MTAGRMCSPCPWAGALMPLSTLQTTGGTDPWFGSFTEADDLCRRICLGGGRVVVWCPPPRWRTGGPDSRASAPMRASRWLRRTPMTPPWGVLEAQQRYYYTDIRTVWWPFLWIWRLLRSVVMAGGEAVAQAAVCGVVRAGAALARAGHAAGGRAGQGKRVVRQGTVPLARLSGVVGDPPADWAVARPQPGVTVERCVRGAQSVGPRASAASFGMPVDRGASGRDCGVRRCVRYALDGAPCGVRRSGRRLGCVGSHGCHVLAAGGGRDLLMGVRHRHGRTPRRPRRGCWC